jgi:hypothetical protein
MKPLSANIPINFSQKICTLLTFGAYLSKLFGCSKMQSREKLLIAGAVLILALAAVLWRLSQDKYNWDISDQSTAYQEQQNEPYSLSVLHELLEETVGDRMEYVHTSGLKVLEKLPPNACTYVFVGEQPYYDSTETKRLLEFVNMGGRALIVSSYLTDLIEDTLFQRQVCKGPEGGFYHNPSLFDTSVYCYLTPNEKQEYGTEYAVYEKEKKIYNQWQHLSVNQICSAVNWQKKGSYRANQVNYAAIKFGEGSFMLHRTPLVFTNLHMIRPAARAYVQQVLAELNTEHIIYDRYAKTVEARNAASRRAKGLKTMRDSGILSTMLREPALAFAWFIFLGMMGLFLVFGSKREQRIIPVIPPLRNQSLQFVQSLARLQFLEQNFKAVCKQDMRFFLNTVREKCNITVPMQANGTVQYNDTLIAQIAKSSGFPEARLRDIFTQYNACTIYEPSGNMMTDLHTSIEQFIHFKKQIGKK